MIRMAGTGHPYEVANLSTVYQSLALFGKQIPYCEGQDWFLSKHVIRYVTSPQFVAYLHVGPSDEDCPDETERAFLESKINTGGDVRIFAPEFLRATGPDFGHIIDWLIALQEVDPSFIRKLHKVTVPVAVEMASAWSLASARKAARHKESGKIGEPMDACKGRLWVEMLDESALKYESAHMNHCVHSYANRLPQGTRIFSLRNAHATPLVTVEIVKGIETEARQIRGPGNSIPPYSYVDDVIILLETLKVSVDHYREVAQMGIGRNHHGIWQPLHMSSQRMDISGIPCLLNNDELYICSSLNPSQIIARIIGLSFSLTTKQAVFQRCNYAVLTLCGERRPSLVEQKAIAQVVNYLTEDKEECRSLTKGELRLPAEIQRHHGGALIQLGYTWTSWTDICSREYHGEVECLRESSNKLHVVRENDESIILVTITQEMKSFCIQWENVAYGTGPHRIWSDLDVKRVLSVMNALDIQRIKGAERGADGRHLSDGGLTEVKLYKWKSQWVREADYLSEEEAGELDMIWRVTPWNKCLDHKNKNNSLCTSLSMDEEGRLFYYQVFHPYAEEAARFLNLHDIQPSRYSSWSQTRWPSKKNNCSQSPVLARMGGLWSAFYLPEEIMFKACQLGKKWFSDPDTNEAVISLSPIIGEAGANEEILAHHLTAWALRLKKMMREYGREFESMSKLSFGETTVNRLILAAQLIHKMTPREKQIIITSIVAFIQGTKGKRKHTYMLSDKIIALLIESWYFLPPKFLDTIAEWALRFNVFVKNKHPVEQCIRILEREANLHVWSRRRHALHEAASSEVFAFARRPCEYPVTNPYDANLWIRLIEQVLDHYGSYMHTQIHTLLSHLETIIRDGIQNNNNYAMQWQNCLNQLQEIIVKLQLKKKAA
jgi:PcfJ-like protein